MKQSIRELAYSDGVSVPVREAMLAMDNQLNSPLLRASPDLLEALQEARNGLVWYQVMHPELVDGSDDEAMDRIDAAIAKARAPQPIEPSDDALRDAITETLSGLYYCNRTWSAWGVGTMTEDDFFPAAEDNDIVQNIVDGVKSVLSAPAHTGVKFNRQTVDQAIDAAMGDGK